MKRKRSLSSLKKQAWKLCSEYIRRHSADPHGYNVCVCCGVKKHWKELHASHLVPGRRLGILFDERGIFPCCYSCNVMKSGNYREFDAYIDKILGVEYRLKLVEELRRNSKRPTKFNSGTFEVLIEGYKHKLKQL